MLLLFKRMSYEINMLYKYRSLKNFKYFVDIIINQRLYASPYFELNDPMEGYYLYSKGNMSEEILKKIKGEKEKIRICSLTRDCSNELMWSHYADGHHGIVVGVEIDSTLYKVKPVIYDGLQWASKVRRNPCSEVTLYQGNE